jgi:DNA-binding response OmpR family regulator
MTRVLIIEDVESMRALLQVLLQGVSGIQVSGAVGNLRDAEFELLRRRPDLVLLDEILPGESIQDFVKILQQEGIPTIVLTSMEEPSHELPQGVANRLSKPGWRSLQSDQKRFELEIRKILKK